MCLSFFSGTGAPVLELSTTSARSAHPCCRGFIHRLHHEGSQKKKRLVTRPQPKLTVVSQSIRHKAGRGLKFAEANTLTKVPFLLLLRMFHATATARALQENVLASPYAVTGAAPGIEFTQGDYINLQSVRISSMYKATKNRPILEGTVH